MVKPSDVDCCTAEQRTNSPPLPNVRPAPEPTRYEDCRELQTIFTTPQKTQTRNSSQQSLKNFVRKRLSRDGNKSSMSLLSKIRKQPKVDETELGRGHDQSRNSLLSARARAEGGYDSDAASLPELGEGIVNQLSKIPEDVMRASPVKRRNSTERSDVQDIEWVGCQPIVSEEPNRMGQAFTDDVPVLPAPNFEDGGSFRLYNPSMPNLVSPTLSDEEKTKGAEQPSHARVQSLRRSRSDSSIVVTSQPESGHERLHSTSSSSEPRIMRLSIQGGSMHSSHFPLPPQYDRQYLILPSAGAGDPQPEKKAGDKLDIKEWPLRSTSETLSSASQTPERKLTLRNPDPVLGSSESASLHLYSMRISQHLRVDSSTSIATTAAPVAPARRRHASSSGFESAKVPSTWGNVVEDKARRDQSSSIYSSSNNTRSNSPDSVPGAPQLPNLDGILSGHENLALEDVSAIVPPLFAKSQGHATTLHDGTTPAEPQELAANMENATTATGLLAPAVESQASHTIHKHPLESTDSTSSEASDPEASEPNKALLTRSNARRFSSLPLIQKSKALLHPTKSTAPNIAVDGGVDDPLDFKPGRLRRALQLGGSNAHDGANQVWERALQAHQEEKSSLFLSPERGGTAGKEAVLFRDRSRSVSRRRGSQVGTSEGSSQRSRERRHQQQNQNQRHVHEQLLDPWGTEPANKARRRKALAGLLGEDVPPDHVGPEIIFDAPSSDESEREVEIDDATLGAWSRYPSHTRNARTGSAGEADHVRAHDFAYDLRLTDLESGEETDRDGLAKQKTKKATKTGLSKAGSVVSFGKTGRFFKEYFKMFRPQSHEFIRHGHGHRTSVAEGGHLEAPELELLPPVFSVYHPAMSPVEEAIELADSPSKHHEASTQVDGASGDALNQRGRDARATDSSHASSEWKMNARLFSTLLRPEDFGDQGASMDGTGRVRTRPKSELQWEADARLWARLKAQLGDEPVEEPDTALMTRPVATAAAAEAGSPVPGPSRRPSVELKRLSQIHSSEDWQTDARLFSQLYEEECFAAGAGTAAGPATASSPAVSVSRATAAAIFSALASVEEVSGESEDNTESKVANVVVHSMPVEAEAEEKGKHARTPSIITTIQLEQF